MSNHPVILFAEDNPHDVELTLSTLAHHNVSNEIVVVPDGAQALDYLFRRGRFKDRPEGNPTIALLDLKMPKVDGLEVLRAIRSDPGLRTIPVVILTSSREEQDLARSYQLGVNAYVLKPVDFQAFVEAIKALGIFWTIHNQPPPSNSPPQS